MNKRESGFRREGFKFRTGWNLLAGSACGEALPEPQSTANIKPASSYSQPPEPDFHEALHNAHFRFERIMHLIDAQMESPVLGIYHFPREYLKITCGFPSISSLDGVDARVLETNEDLQIARRKLPFDSVLSK